MFTATTDQILPTTVTGSWPRPRWFDAQLAVRPLSTCMKDVGWREQYTDALSAVIDDQEQGANIVRRELGLEERYVPIADPALQVEGRSPEQETRLFGGLVKN